MWFRGCQSFLNFQNLEAKVTNFEVATLTYTRAQRIVTPCSKTIHTRPRPVQDHPHRTPNPFVARRHLPLLQVSEYRFKNIFCTSELFLKMQHLEDIRNSSLNVVWPVSLNKACQVQGKCSWTLSSQTCNTSRPSRVQIMIHDLALSPCNSMFLQAK